MPYTVKQVATMSGVSVRTLHFYDEVGLLKPAFYGANGYRFYEEAQLLMLQQALFYRELGFDLYQIRQTLGRGDFEKAAALRSHREILQKKIDRMRKLMETIDRTITHLDGTKRMEDKDMFAGFSVGAGEDRFNEHIKLGDDPNDCKISSKDTNGAICVFEYTGTSGGPRHLHHDQDEWVYIVNGEFQCEVGDEKRYLGNGESIFLPRNVRHAWACVGGKPGKIINMYQPAGKMEAFFREIGKYQGAPKIHEALLMEELSKLFSDHGMDMVGPPLVGEWNVEDDGRITQTA
jgi:DNA-binding transcriptional MerR regulator/quercetin dioxygenase-like cupin family protein